MMNRDTIAAIATPPGTGGIGIIRMSGPEAEKILNGIFRPAGTELPLENRKLTYGRVTDGDNILDECMAVIMRAPGRSVRTFRSASGTYSPRSFSSSATGSSVRFAPVTRQDLMSCCI